MKVLVISSVTPFKGPGIVALTIYNAFLNMGYEVDFLTKYPVPERPDFISVYTENPLSSKYVLHKKIIFLLKRKLLSLIKNRHIRQQKEGYMFFYEREDCPPVPVKDILKKITKQYDTIHVVFWQRLLSFQTIEAIYDQQLNCQFFFNCVDYSPMAGGCHFTGDCLRYQTGCGKCPAIKSNKEDDFTAFNVQFRKRVYNKVKPVVTGNGYMHTFYDKSYLLRDYNRCMRTYFLLDTDEYKPLDRIIIRQIYNISDNKKFLMLWGCRDLNDSRKGSVYLLEAIKILYNKLSEKERNSILLITIGNSVNQIKDKILFDNLHLGYVTQDKLPEIYNLADIFLSPSINDAGPSMVNQSISCGTPVVAFEMGTALDMVKDKGTGYCAKLRDAEDYARGIEMILKLSEQDYIDMRIRCRKIAEELTSERAFIQRTVDIYDKYNS